MPSLILRIVIVLLLTVISLHAQESRATLNGHITDPSGAGVLNATVTATNIATNLEVQATTTEDGNYTIPFLQPGTYNVAATAGGFKRAVRESIVLQVGGTSTVN